jgi:hypothetical protein
MLLSTISPSGGSNPAEPPRSMTWSDSSASHASTTHCRHDESGQPGTQLEESSTYALLSVPCPLDYHLFCFLSNNLCGVSFNNDAELQNWLNFFTAKLANFFKCGIENLPERWEVLVNNGEYIID